MRRGRIYQLRHGLVALVLCASVSCGTSQPLPETHPVSGTIAFQGGGALPAGALLEFRSTTETRYTTLADVRADGGFSVHTLAGRDRLEGAVAGDYQITVIMPDAGASSQAQKMVSITLPQTHTVKAGGTTTLRIEVPKGKR